MIIFPSVILFCLFCLKTVYLIKINDSIKKNLENKRDNNIWLPTAGTTWNWILNAHSKDIKSDSNVDVLDIDLFDNDKKKIESLKKDGHHIVCYFSAGTYEDWRPDAEEFLKINDLVRDEMEEWDGENFLDITNPQLKPLMSKRLDLAKEKGCDAVEPDNVDIYTFNEVKKWRVPVTKEDQLNYDIWLATEAHARGLSIALKNDISNLSEMVKYFDFAVNEECYDYNECGEYDDTFIKQNKAVFVAAYGDRCNKKFLNKLLNNTKGKNLSIIIKDKELGPSYVTFDPENYNYDYICHGINNEEKKEDEGNNNNNNENENQNSGEITDDNKNLEKEEGEVNNNIENENPKSGEITDDNKNLEKEEVEGNNNIENENPKSGEIADDNKNSEKEEVEGNNNIENENPKSGEIVDDNKNSEKESKEKGIEDEEESSSKKSISSSLYLFAIIYYIILFKLF